VPAGLIRILDRDLKLAGIPKKDDRGRTLDVHALRHSFGTLLSVVGAAPRTAQAAMRHSDLSLTMNVYTDPKLLDVRAALNALPALTIEIAGTHDIQSESVQTSDLQFAPLFAPAADKTRQAGSKADKMEKICERAIDAADNHSANENDLPQTTCSKPSKERATRLELATSSLGS